jgi:hypothetical protein
MRIHQQYAGQVGRRHALPARGVLAGALRYTGAHLAACAFFYVAFVL